MYRDRLSKCRCLSCRKQYIDFMLFCSCTILLLSTYLAENVDSDCRGNKVVSFGIMTVSPLLNFIHPLPLVVLYKLQVQKRAYSRYQFNSVFVMSLSYLPCLSSLLLNAVCRMHLPSLKLQFPGIMRALICYRNKVTAFFIKYFSTLAFAPQRCYFTR